MKSNYDPKTARLIVAILLTVVFSNLVAEGSKDLLYGVLKISPDGIWANVVIICISLLGFGMVSLWIKKLTEEYLSVRHLKNRTGVKSHQAVIMMASTPSGYNVDSSEGKVTIQTSKSNVSLSEDIAEDIDQLDRLNLQQFLRALKPHLGALKYLFLLSSGGKNGSYEYLTAFEMVVRHYVGDSVQVFHQGSEHLSFDDLEGVYQEFKSCIDFLSKEKKVSHGEIMIDVTGGTKTASIAAALATLEHEDIELQYVQTTSPYGVVSYNVISKSQGKVTG
ncbi:hypothetical protein [Ferrovum myxofaciens]|jgi:hypothetical protein|nr:hypothetical protein [Ferrovum myxofaciens]MBU6995024.1 hypothetical protein [Ferrovum myxofaciens]QKE38824.1 MAG: hypothetical protein HO273_08805 [Ferrovum myxofaciens]QKE41411.1 MAG: hypothetical protein HO274_08840 [Ferrovum myxofaciens]QWY74034.1 MAG: hypothetical protein JVY19_09325 [Ferrovum myxofaciens]